MRICAPGISFLHPLRARLASGRAALGPATGHRPKIINTLAAGAAVRAINAKQSTTKHNEEKTTRETSMNRTSSEGIATSVQPARRRLLKAAAGVSGVSLAGAAGIVHAAAPKVIRIGYVSPRTGPLAVFAEPDAFTLEQVKKAILGNIN
jgi:hypothetical protein